MLILSFFLISTISSNLVLSRLYFSGYRNSFKAIRLDLPNTNIILSSPHAGSEMPNDIPDRSLGGCKRTSTNLCTFYFNDSCTDGNRCSVTTVQDFASFDPFVEQLVNEINRRYNLLPFAIIAKWNRKKVDFNREINEATFNHPQAIKSYTNYHHYLQKAIKRIERKFNGKGLLIDIHQHGQGK